MNRRKLFSFLAAAPVATMAVAEQLAAAPAAVEPIVEPSEYPLDYRHDLVVEPGYSFPYYDNCTHRFEPNIPGRAVTRRQIWDGTQFIPFDSAQGAAVLNKVLIGKA